MECDLRPYRIHHVWSSARAEAIRRAEGRCEVCRSEPVEVHHDPPLAGQGRGPSCAHHQDRLRVLCRRHHLERHVAMRAPAGYAIQLSLIAA